MAVELELQERALARRDAFRQFHNPTRLAQFICGADLLRRGAAYLSSRAPFHFVVEAERPVATGSPDHQHPHGTRLDNSKNQRFNEKLYALFSGRQIGIIDVGCSGGGFVKSCLDDGHVAVGLEGSDYSKRTGRAEWGRIPDSLFTCDATSRFFVQCREPGSHELVPARFDVVTSWEFIEHVKTEDLPAVCANVERHLTPGGIWIPSVSPNEEVIDGVRLHLTVQARSWWVDFFESAGFKNHPDLVAYFADDWVRDPMQNAPDSFHLVLAALENASGSRFWRRLISDNLLWGLQFHPVLAQAVREVQQFPAKSSPCSEDSSS